MHRYKTLPSKDMNPLVETVSRHKLTRNFGIIVNKTFGRYGLIGLDQAGLSGSPWIMSVDGVNSHQLSTHLAASLAIMTGQVNGNTRYDVSVFMSSYIRNNLTFIASHYPQISVSRLHSLPNDPVHLYRHMTWPSGMLRSYSRTF